MLTIENTNPKDVAQRLDIAEGFAVFRPNLKTEHHITRTQTLIAEPPEENPGTEQSQMFMRCTHDKWGVLAGDVHATLSRIKATEVRDGKAVCASFAYLPSTEQLTRLLETGTRFELTSSRHPSLEEPQDDSEYLPYQLRACWYPATDTLWVRTGEHTCLYVEYEIE